MVTQFAQVKELTRTITDEIFNALGMSPRNWLRKVLGPIFWLPARRFSELGASFDEYVARSGFREAARWVLPRFVEKLEVRGAERLPEQGPLLVASNHPGTYDSIAIAASLPRNDLKIVAGGIPFIRGLPATSGHMLYATHDTHERMLVIRNAIRHLQDGGCVLIFPTGSIDPDPAFLPGAQQALANWSASIEVFLRRVPQTNVVVTIVSGVLESRFFRHPLTRLRQELRDRQRIAEILQIIQQMVLGYKFPLLPRVSFAEPLIPAELRGDNTLSGLLPMIVSKAQQLLSEHLGQSAPEPASS